MARRACKGTNKSGKPCGARPLKDHDVCMVHAPKELQVATGFGGIQPGAGRPKLKRVVDIIRERLDAEIDEWYQVLLDARVATKPVGVGEGDDFLVIHTPDHTTRLAAFREAFDRAYGKPRQAVEHSGPDGSSLQVTVPMDPHRERDLTMILVQAGAIELPQSPPTNGHGNGNGHLPDIDA